MGHHRLRLRPSTSTSTKSYTLPSSPTHSFSSSSSEFEFAVSLSPRKSSAADLCPADDLFYKGQLLPLHPSPRLSMVRNLLLSSSSSSSSSSDATTTASRDSTDSSSSSTDVDELKHPITAASKKPSKYFSLPKLFRKDHAAVKCVSSGAREVIRRYLKKVKPFYEKLSQKHPQPQHKSSRISSFTNTVVKDYKSQELSYHKEEMINTHSSFSGNLRLYNRRGRSCFSSCPPSMGSSPARPGSAIYASDTSSMEELHSAIQGAIMHCKNSMLQTNNLVGTNQL